MEFTFIRGCAAAKKLSPEWMKAFDKIMPMWLERYLQAYTVCKERGVSFFEIANVIDEWSENEKFEKDGFSYISWNRPNDIKTMAFDGHRGNGHVDWRSMMDFEYPNLYDNYDPDYKRTGVRLSDFGTYHWYFWRYMNTKSPYDYVANRVREYFRLLTNDPKVIFSLGFNSYITFDEKGLRYADTRRYKFDD